MAHSTIFQAMAGKRSPEAAQRRHEKEVEHDNDKKERTIAVETTRVEKLLECREREHMAAHDIREPLSVEEFMVLVAEDAKAEKVLESRERERMAANDMGVKTRVVQYVSSPRHQ